MAAPVPICPLIAPTYSEQRGPNFVDPITKSQKSVPTVYTEKNVCDVDAYKVFSISANVNQLSANCENVQAATISVSGRLPVCADESDLAILLGIVLPDLEAEFTA